MARNVEIKVRVDDPDAVLARAIALAGAEPESIDQDDAFYAVAQGRLKLRRFADGSAELIHYERADAEAAKASDYVRVPVPDADALDIALARACGRLGRVRKVRRLVIVGQTRVHVDRVDGLGDFVELEVVLHDGQDDAAGAAIADALLAALGLAEAERVAGAYRDLLDPAASASGSAAARKS
jgi:predicted adenylyl cyclase CyaB